MKKIKVYLHALYNVYHLSLYYDCVSGFHWFALELSQTFASVFTRLWQHRKHVLFFKCRTIKTVLIFKYVHSLQFSIFFYILEENLRRKNKVIILSFLYFLLFCLSFLSEKYWLSTGDKKRAIRIYEIKSSLPHLLSIVLF